MAKRLAKVVLVSVLSIVVTALLAATIFIAYPQLALNNRTLPWLGKVLRGYNIPVTWSTAQWSVESLSFFNKRITINADNLCYATSEPYRRVCLESIKTTFTFHLWTRKLAIEDLDIPKATATLEAGAQAEPSSEPFNPFSLVQQLREQVTSIDWRHVSVGDLALVYTDGEMALRMKIGLEGVGNPRSLRLSTDGYLSRKAKRSPLQATLSLTLPNEGELAYSISGSWGIRRDSWKLETNGKIAADSLRGVLNADFKKPVRPAHSSAAKRMRLPMERKRK